MRIFIVLMLLVSTTAHGQKKRKGLDVVSNIDVKVLAMKPLGNNSLAKYIQTIKKIKKRGKMMKKINFGIGLD